MAVDLKSWMRKQNIYDNDIFDILTSQGIEDPTEDFADYTQNDWDEAWRKAVVARGKGLKDQKAKVRLEKKMKKIEKYWRQQSGIKITSIKKKKGKKKKKKKQDPKSARQKNERNLKPSTIHKNRSNHTTNSESQTETVTSTTNIQMQQNIEHGSLSDDEIEEYVTINNKRLLGMDKLVYEMIKKVNVNGYNCKVFMERAVKKMGEKGILNAKEFGWKVVYNSSENEYDEKAIDNDEKENNNKLSQLIDVQNTYTEMCCVGHGDKWKKCSWNKCISCGLKKDNNKGCWDCFMIAVDNGMDAGDAQDACTYCSDCRSRNSDNIKKRISKRIKMDGMISQIMRRELLKNPSLELDLLCCMKRRAALDSIIYDINKLTYEKRSQWCLFVFDLDFIGAWNSCLGHVKADGLIKIIGGIIQSNINDINNGKWIDNSLLRGFVYRTGGCSEFAIVIECEFNKTNLLGAAFCSFGPFYNQMKKEINDLGKSIKDLLNFNKKDWKQVKEKLDYNSIDMSCVGVSAGLYVSYMDYGGNDWLTIADKVALEHAKEVYLPKKNGISIYYEEIGGLVDDKNVEKCLKHSCVNIYTPQ